MLPVVTRFCTGANLAATLQRLSDDFYWNPTAVAFQVAPAYADKKIALAEGAAENLESYTASVASLGNAGRLLVRVHDEDNANLCIGTAHTGVLNGEEVQDVGIVDEHLRRDQSLVPAPVGTDRTPNNANRKLTNRVKIDEGAGKLTVYEEDDTTTAFEQTITTDPNAEPLTEVDTI
jgi:hypothetical protein